jgi:2-dehydro-3-deoxygalactonokinase
MQLITVDWGTSSFRATRWQFDNAANNAKVVDRLESNQGLLAINKIIADSIEANDYMLRFEKTLLDAVGHWLDQPSTILMSGMVGSKTGWLQAPYINTPASLDKVAEQLVEVRLSPEASENIRAFIVPGVCQNNPPDVMRGEETQLFGLHFDQSLEQTSRTDSFCILPGTHSKHVYFSGGQIVRFKTYMTGELFALLSSQSILAGLCKPNQFDQLSFENAVVKANTDSDLQAQLFSLRAQSLLQSDQAFCTASALSGLLIGNELRALDRSTSVLLVGSDTMCDRYGTALKRLGIQYRIGKNKSAELGALRIAIQAQLLN